jgi:hypothetical protein
MGEQRKREVWAAEQEARFRACLALRERDLAVLARGLAEALAAGQVTLEEVRALVRLAHQTWSVSDITDWIKTRVGRDGAFVGWDRAGVGVCAGELALGRRTHRGRVGPPGPGDAALDSSPAVPGDAESPGHPPRVHRGGTGTPQAVMVVAPAGRTAYRHARSHDRVKEGALSTA